MDKIAVLIPCYNESKTVEKVVRDFKQPFMFMITIPPITPPNWQKKLEPSFDMNTNRVRAMLFAACSGKLKPNVIS